MTWTTRPRSDFGALAAIRAGSGSRVILLHGVGLRAEAWGAQIDALATAFEIVAPDMAGHGQSPRLSPPVTLAAYTDTVASAMDAPAIVTGHSMGAMIALDLAIRYPERVTGVAALNAIFRRTSEAAAAVRARADSLDGKTAGDPSGPLERWFGAAPSLAADACREWLTTVDPAGYRDAYAVFAAEDGPSDAALGGLRCPALFLTGGDDPNSTPAMSDAMAVLAPDGQAQTVPGAAHMMPMTHAAEVNDTLRRFFRHCTT
ncbi:MAG: alpha/beta hydrolase [Pseudomonadota bacterium]